MCVDVLITAVAAASESLGKPTKQRVDKHQSLPEGYSKRIKPYFVICGRCTVPGIRVQAVARITSRMDRTAKKASHVYCISANPKRIQEILLYCLCRAETSTILEKMASIPQ